MISFRFSVWLSLALICGAIFAHAQVPMTGAGPGTPNLPASYIGPGDVVAGAKAWWSAVRAFSSADRGNRLMNVCNSTGGVDVGCADMSSDAVTGTVVPATISGITCPGANCTVKIFYDRSGANDCSGPCDNTASTISNRAALTAICCAVFSGSQGYVSPASLSAHAGNNTLYYVAKRTGAFTSQQFAISSFGTVGGIGIGWPSSPDNVFAYPSGASASAADSACHNLTAIYNQGTPSSSNMFVDGGSNVVTLSAGTGDTWSIGALTTPGTQSMTGEFREGGFWAQLFSGTDATNLNTNTSSYGGC